MTNENELLILGCGSATPTSSRFPTSQVLRMRDELFLIDCGEGAQIQMRRNGVRFGQIDHVFISHLHGDHFFGLVGFLSSLHLLDRKKTLYLYGPPGLVEILELQFRSSGTRLRYPIEFTPLNPNSEELILETKKVEVRTLKMDHSIDTWGFVFTEKPKLRNLIKSKLEELSIPRYVRDQIKQGSDWDRGDGTVIPNHELTTDPPPIKSYAFFSDTAYVEENAQKVAGVDLMYHEATFAAEDADKAHKTQHSTTLQAATMALKAKAKKLIIGHFSARYDSAEPLVREAKTIFEETVAGQEGGRYIL
ncbi:ribonuclease Z [Cryomorphaceae bacterium]|nr:ribonuclease Z [Cryomorphaceae bacterium]